MGDTFLTQPDLPEPEGMTRVREEHSRLQGVVFSLNKRISQVLAKQEGDFLAAYRAHMYTVQKELQTLRQRVIEAENVLQVRSSVRNYLTTSGSMQQVLGCCRVSRVCVKQFCILCFIFNLV